MAATIKDSVYKAIDVIVGKRIEDLHLDKTIEAIVEDCIDITSHKYRLRYGSGVFDAYAMNNDIYMPDTAVYVLIPENDFNKKKTIIGRANTGTQTNINEEQSVASMYSGYSVIGTNLLTPVGNSTNKYNLRSYDPENNTILLYDADQPQEKNKVNINNEKLKVYLEEAKGFIFSGKFKTNFMSTLSGREDYGLVFYLSLKNGKTTFETMEERWKVQEPKTSCFIDEEEWSLNTYRKKIEEYQTIAQEQLISSPMSEQKIVKNLQDSLAKEQIKLRSFVTELTSFVDTESLELANLYIQLIDDLINYTVNEKNEPVTVQDLQYQYDNWFTGSSYAFQEQEYAVELNTNYMTGNVYHYPSLTYQYRFVEIDPDVFIRVNSIYFYAKNFTKNLELSANGSDIEVQDVSITCIKYLDNVNGDYRLDLEYDDIYFDSSANDKDALTITAKMTYKNNTDITDYSTIMWFKKNGSITSDSMYYSMYAGAGWEHLTSISNLGVQDKSNTLTLKAEDNLSYRNIYKVVGMYESSTIVQQEFTIYNDKHKHNISLISDSGLNFGVGSGKKRITCVIDGYANVDLEQYNFIWYVELSDGNYYKILNQDSLQELEDSINNENITATEKINRKTQLNILKNIQWYDSNYIIVDSAAVPHNSSIKIICVVQANNIELDELTLTLTSGYSVNLKNYYIEIINGNQVFQYNEAGISPTSTIYEDPQEILPLSCNFYDPAGGIINPLNYTVSWEIPIINTLIHVDEDALMYNVVSDKNNLLRGNTCSFTINKEYNYNSTDNQIICIIEFDDGDGLVTYRQPTNFFFGKIGDDGTNGTDIVNKITVIHNDHADLTSHYNNNTLLDELLTLKVEQSDGITESNIFWNNGLSLNDPILQLELFRKNNIINSKEYRKVNWSILNNGLTSKYWRTQNIEEEASGAKQVILIYDTEKNNNNKSYTNYIIKGQADLPIDEEKYQTYYNFYPICVDTKYPVSTKSYTNATNDNITSVNNNYIVGIDRARTLRQVVYNSDGRNPLYDKNLGVGLSFKNLDYPRTITWEPHGGIILDNKQGEVFPAFSLGKNISYVAGQNNVVSDTINELESLRDSEIEEKELSQYNNAISIIQDNINMIIDDLTNQKNIIDSQLIELTNTRTNNWNNFSQQRKNAISEMYNKLCNQIDDILWSTNPDWVLEDFLYISDPIPRKYYNDQTNTFKADIDDYLMYYLDVIDNPNVISQETLEEYQTKITNLEEILTHLFVNIDIDNRDDAKDIELSFITLINLLIVGYNTYKVLYDKKNQELSNNINTLQENKTEIEQELSDYNLALSDINDSTELIIKNILFDISGDNYLENAVLADIVNTTKLQFEEEILIINNKYAMQIAFLTGILTDDSDPTFCSILPNEVYSGEYPNQYVKIKIYQGILDEIDNNSILEHELIVPIHMSLNTYGLASLNAWDGNSVEINEDEGYVLAPQIGAGIKHVEDNAFTGVLMGTEKTFDDAAGQEEVGLLGYSHGKRSIFLDASTGNATFGLLEEDAADVSNPLTEGRIELRPGGTSSISKWNFDSRSLYRVASDDETEAILQARAYTEQLSASSLGAPYEDAPQYAHGSIPHTKQGILLSALPAYASFKGRILTEKDHTDERVNYLNLNTSVREGDTFELQIDPNDSRFFSLYEHSTRIYEGYGTCDTWNGYKAADKYPMTEAEFNKYFNISALANIDKENTIILTQRYLKSNSNGELKQVFRPLSYLYQENNIYYWKLINPTVDKRHRATIEYVIATLKQYSDWQNDNTKQTVWTYITFAKPDGTNPDRIPLIAQYNSKGKLIGLSLFENDENVNEETKVWHRYKKAGIDATGKFVSEGVGTGAVGLGLNDIQAFNLGSLFIGANFESNNGTIVQFFVDKLSTQANAPLFISSTKTLSDPSVEDTSKDNEGKRPIRIYAGNNSDVITDANYLSSGIFVGASHDKDPQDSITKLELRQTSLDDNIITLAALGTNTDINSSVLMLNSSSEVEQEGSLKHTGSWTTIIGKKLNTVIGDSISFVGKDINATLTNGFSATSNSSNNKITLTNSSMSFINQTNNQWSLGNTSNFKAKEKIMIVGGQGNAAGRVSDYGLRLYAWNTTQGLILNTSNTNTVKSTSKGDVFFELMPSAKDTNARFKLQSGNSGYIYSSNRVVTSAGYGVVIGPGLQIKDDGTGFIKCNGQYITNTATGYNATPKISGSDGVGLKRTLTIPNITGSGKTSGTNYFRPTITTTDISFTHLTAEQIWSAISAKVDNAIDTKLKNAKFASSTHTHNIGNLHTYYGFTKISNTTGKSAASMVGTHDHTVNATTGFKAFSTRDTTIKTGGPVG